MPILIDPTKKQPAQSKRGERMSPTGDVFWNPKNGKAERGADNRLRSKGERPEPEPRKGRAR